MAEKEERILIDILPPASGFGSCGGFYTEGVGEYFCVWNGEKKPVTEEICNKCPYDKSMTRQEAIERMAKALIRADYPHAQESVWDMRWDNPASKDYYLIMANSALNALLGE